jgi:tetratricopeptide (TPR) repeat protein
MRPRRLVSWLFGVALLLAALPAPVAAQIGRVAGVVKEESGQAIKGATITAEHPDSGQTFTATTDDKGRFMMIGLRGGVWRFVAQAPGFSPGVGALSVRVGAQNPPVAFALKKSGVMNYGPLGGVSGKDLQNALAEADRLFSQSRWDDAIAAYKTIMERTPTLSAINLQLAEAYRQKKDYPAALSAYEALLKSDPDSERAFIGVAAIHRERGDAAAAEEVLVRAAERVNAGRDVFYQLAEAKASTRDTDAAANWYEKAAAADPSWGKPIYKLGLAAIDKGDTAGATKLLAQVIAVDPTSPEAALAKSSLESLNK